MLLRNNRALFGALLILTGVYILVSPKLPVFGSLPSLALGAALLLLYYNKRKVWALAVGTFLFETALVSVLNRFGIHAFSIPAVVFLFIPGTIFMTLFLTKNMQGLLIPASLLLWVGFGLAFKSIFGLQRALPVILICVGMAFATVYLLGSLKNSRSFLVLGIVICAFGVNSFITRGLLDFSEIGWLIVIALFAVLIIKARRDRRNNGGDDLNE